MSPTRELAQQIEVEANRFGKCIGISVVSMYGGAPKWEQVQAYKRGVHAIIACPGRLNDCLEGGQVTRDRIGSRCWCWMRPTGCWTWALSRRSRLSTRLPAARHTMFFTATWPREVRQLASTMLRNPYRVMIGNRENLKANQDVVQEVRIVEGRGKEQALQELLSEAGLTQPGAIGKCLVFVGTKRMCEEISVNLCRAGVQCASIHGDKDQFQRDQALANLKSGYYRVLAATDVAARGLDIKGIGLVINYDIPNNTEDYVHRIGRTGRAGAKGYAVTFVTRNDGGKISGIIKIMEGANQDIPPEIRALSRGGGGGGGNRGGGGGGGWGGGGGSCVWCAKGECWTHGGKGKGRSRSPKGHG
ncbi:unnamed protein product [Prorocentrum cordatum]|uniref:RNA helicase n=1 Tax=Prorocentrum cordatum TaxID=2364126 RepID=A0ABN9YDB4_9DINO|nr:unnamed protein product [Polarella glacialis]